MDEGKKERLPMDALSVGYRLRERVQMAEDSPEIQRPRWLRRTDGQDECRGVISMCYLSASLDGMSQVAIGDTIVAWPDLRAAVRDLGERLDEAWRQAMVADCQGREE